MKKKMKCVNAKNFESSKTDKFNKTKLYSSFIAYPEMLVHQVCRGQLKASWQKCQLVRWQTRSWLSFLIDRLDPFYALNCSIAGKALNQLKMRRKSNNRT